MKIAPERVSIINNITNLESIVDLADISVCLTKNTSYGLIGINDDYMRLYYNNELIYYVNARPLGLDIYGNELKSSEEEMKALV